MATAALSLRNLIVSDFSGGLNLREAPSELANNESPDIWNMTLDERGGAVKRLGYIKSNPTVYGGGLVSNQFYWPTGGDKIVQAGASLYLGDSTTASKTFTTSARVGFAEFTDRVYVIHPIDGLFYSTDGLTFTAVGSGPKGTTLASWQGRLLAGGDPSNKSRLYASGIGDGTDWLTTAGHGWTNDIREKDGQSIVVIGGLPGVDILGRPGLIVCKDESTYRVYDSSNGAYQTLDPQIGAASSLAVVNVAGKTVICSKRGIYWTDGTNALKKASTPLDPLFTTDGIAYDQLSLVAGGVFGDRAYFSLPRAGETGNTFELEYHALQGWIVPHSCAASCYTTYGASTQKLLAGSPTVSGQVYERFRTGSDDGAAIAARLQTKWYAPSGGLECMFRQLHVFGRGLFSAYTKIDFDQGDGELTALSLPGGALVWGTGLWGTGLWAPANYEDSTVLYSLGEGSHISFEFRHSGTESASAPPMLDIGSGREVGAMAVYGLVLKFVPKEL